MYASDTAKGGVLNEVSTQTRRYLYQKSDINYVPVPFFTNSLRKFSLGKKNETGENEKTVIFIYCYF